MSRILIVLERSREHNHTALDHSLASQTDPNWTLDSSRDDIVATMMVDDNARLRPDAVAIVRACLAEHPALQIITGDAIVGGVRALRPAWSPTRLRSAAHEIDLLVVRGRTTNSSLAARVAALGAAADDTIGHLPVALIERDEPVLVDVAVERALDELAASRKRAPVPESVAFLIPTAGTRRAPGEPMVRGAIDAARRARGLRGSSDEILLIVGDEFQGDPRRLAAPDVRLVHRRFPWNFAAAMNLGLLEAEAEAVVLLNDDVEALESGWLDPMLEHLRDPTVGLVGASLAYPDGTIQHHGVVLDDAFPLHPYVGQRPADLSASVRAAHEVAAVTAACALGRRPHLLEVGGFWELLPASFNDVDLCLKLLRVGRRVILEPSARLVHYESASREASIEPWEWDTFVGRWGQVEDPWYHPGHYRPDDPADRRRNADHLPARDPFGAWPLRTMTVQPSPHVARLRLSEELTVG